MMTRETMIDNLIRRYGFEHPWVVAFCTWCEKWEENEWNNNCLQNCYDVMINHVEEDEEEE